jgi:murein DD-endopeptidase MepM/ murein hydrolase activator NlpD
MEYINRKSVSKKDYLLSLPVIQPINNPDLTRLAAGYGWKIHPIYKIKKFHPGVDFTAPKGEPVVATADGVVVSVTKTARGYGNSVTIDHENGYKTLYAHLDEVKIRKGKKVKRGDVIGTVGSSGVSLAPHLHYEVIKDGERVDPINYFFLDLTPEEYDKIIEIANNSGQSFD